MLFIEERQSLILNMVQQNGRVTVQELVKSLDLSESTIRRDLTDMDKRGLLTKVHGGAIANTERVTRDVSVSIRTELHKEQKIAIARYAASLIQDDDVVYLDAGTTVGYMIPYIDTTNTVYITNDINHAKQLCAKDFQVYMPGGLLKNETEALTGHKACKFVENFHFNKVFLGTNGITRSQGCTTPELKEGSIKETAANQTSHCYILADSSKFGAVSTYTFCKYQDVTILTDADVPEKYKGSENLIICQ